MLSKEISGYTRLAAFFANPAKHSISPAMHNAAFQLTGIDARYLAFEIEKENLGRSIQSIRDLKMMGANISMPFKTEAMQYMDDLSEEVQLIGAMNTIVNRNGKLTGYNTDGKGFMRSLEDINVSIIGKTILIFGCGGAASAITAQAALDGVKRIYVFNRQGPSFAAFTKKAREIMEKTSSDIILAEDTDTQMLIRAFKESSLVVNASSIGMKPLENSSPLVNTDLLRPDMAVVDIIYNPFETKLLQQARAKGCITENGLGMLLYQGALAFSLWTGEAMPIDSIKEIVLQQQTNAIDND